MNLHIELTKTLKPYLKDRFLVAVSGGLDSMALFHLFLHFRKHFGLEFSVVHFHHGPSVNEELQAYRFWAHKFVQEQCEGHQIEFFSNLQGSSPDEFLASFQTELKSEEDLRKARYLFFEQCLREKQHRWVALAHHQEDQLETRLMRLIRGTGPDGLQAMELERDLLLRPLLQFSKKDLQNYLLEIQAGWLEDPSNRSLDPLRNWIRSRWLKDLEAEFPGSCQSLHRSLDTLVSSLDQPEEVISLGKGSHISISELLVLSPPQQRQVLATYMRGQGLKNYGVSHINEILKRLDREEKSHTFRLLGRCWNVDAGRMSVEELS